MFKLFPKALYFVCGLSAHLSVKVEDKTWPTGSTTLISVFRVQKCVKGYSIKEADLVTFPPRGSAWDALMLKPTNLVLLELRNGIKEPDTSAPRTFLLFFPPVIAHVINHENPFATRKFLFCIWNSKVQIIYCGSDTCLILQEYVLQHCWLWTLYVSLNISANQSTQQQRSWTNKMNLPLSCLPFWHQSMPCLPCWKMHTENESFSNRLSYWSKSPQSHIPIFNACQKKNKIKWKEDVFFI